MRYQLSAPNKIHGQQLVEEILAAHNKQVEVVLYGENEVEITGADELDLQSLVTAHDPQPPGSRQIPKRVWMHRISKAKQRAIRKSNNDDVQDMLEELRMASVVDLDDPEQIVQQGVDLMLFHGLIDQTDKENFLAPWFP